VLNVLVFFQELVLFDLLAETTYSVTVAAYTTKGDGARSKPKLVTTTGAGRFRAVSVDCSCGLYSIQQVSPCTHYQ